MAMKWRPNDLMVANILRRNFSEKEIDENFHADIDRREFPEIIGFYREVNPLLSMTFVVNSSAFSLCEDYQQDAWNPYPEILPPEEGEYLITVKIGERSEVRIGRWGIVGCDVEWVGEIQTQIQGFKELPEPYKKGGLNGNHTDTLRADPI